MDIRIWIVICVEVLATNQPMKITFIPQHGVMLEHGDQELYVIQHLQHVEIGLEIKAPKFSNKNQFPTFLCKGLKGESLSELNTLVLERIKGYFQDSENVVAKNYLNNIQDQTGQTTQGKLGGKLISSNTKLLQKERPQAPPPQQEIQWKSLMKWFDNVETSTKTKRTITTTRPQQQQSLRPRQKQLLAQQYKHIKQPQKKVLYKQPQWN